MLLTMLLTFTLTVLAMAVGWFARRWYVSSRPMIEQRGEKTCGICSTPLAANALRTHDGRWRCLKHKDRL